MLQKMINKIEACKSISYDALSKSSNPFSDATYTEVSQISYAVQNTKTKMPLYNISLNSTDNNNISYATHNIYNGKDLLNIDLTDKTYVLKKDYKESTYSEASVYDLVKSLKDEIKNKQFTIIQLKDSAINRTTCYHIWIRTVDSVAEKTNSYIHRDLLIGKKSYLPVYYKTNQQGVAEKGGMVIGTIKMYSMVYFIKYKLNKVFPSTFALKIPAGFKEERPPLPLLAKGTLAPNWSLTATDGKTISMASLRGKVTLLDITAIGCAACVLSVPPLNKLHEKYKGDVAIVSINLSDTRDAIVKFREKNHVDYPVYVNGNAIKIAYHVGPIPTFYIINKQGIISEAYDGFFENFEQEVSSKIEALR